MPAPMYEARLAGRKRREYFADAASEAGASTRLAAPGRDVQPAYHDVVRSNAIAGANAQTGRHFDIRRQIASDAEASRRADMDDVRMWAEMAMTGDFRQAELGLRRNALEMEGQQFQERMQLEDKSLNQAAVENAAERGARASEAEKDREFASREQSIRDIQAMNEAEKDRQFTAKEHRRDRRGRRAIESQRQQDAAAETQRKNRQSNTGMYTALLPTMGYDVSALSDPMKGEGLRKQFEDTAAYIAGLPEWADATEAEIARQAAEDTGLAAPGSTAGTGARTNAVGRAAMSATREPVLDAALADVPSTTPNRGSQRGSAPAPARGNILNPIGRGTLLRENVLEPAADVAARTIVGAEDLARKGVNAVFYGVGGKKPTSANRVIGDNQRQRGAGRPPADPSKRQGGGMSDEHWSLAMETARAQNPGLSGGKLVSAAVEVAGAMRQAKDGKWYMRNPDGSYVEVEVN